MNNTRGSTKRRAVEPPSASYSRGTNPELCCGVQEFRDPLGLNIDPEASFKIPDLRNILKDFADLQTLSLVGGSTY